MARNVLLSFLGTSSYKPVRYFLEEKGPQDSCKLEKFIQKSLLDELSSFFQPTDVAYIFLTHHAREKNWKSSENYIGLYDQVFEKYHFPVKDITVSDQSSTNSIWDTFMAIYDILEPDDIVYLDITHSWRYLPLLGATLLNYAKALKSIQVKAIYYGALEQLGTSNTIDDIPQDERWTPVLNLVSLSDLQEWSLAAQDFVTYGNAERWGTLANLEISPILSGSKGADKRMRTLRDINNQIQKLVPIFTTNRGSALLKYNFENLIESVDSILSIDHPIKPLNPILNLVKEKVTKFSYQNPLNWMEAVKWCINHQLIQQGITQLQEGLLTWLCLYFQNGKIHSDYFDWKKSKPRNLLSSALNIIADAKPIDTWQGELGENKTIGLWVTQFAIMHELSPIYKGLTTLRNDINHGGYTEGMKAEDFKSNLQKHYEAITAILSQDPKPFVEMIPARVLLNVSNHPFKAWSAEQERAALAQFDRVDDLPFPAIDPVWTDIQVVKCADEYVNKILDKRPVAVHLMGEMTFTYALAQKLKIAGIPCVASTTIREVIDHGDGRKEAQFRFVQFRPYF